MTDDDVSVAGTGIRAYDLAAPGRALIPLPAPLWDSTSPARRAAIERERREREAQTRQAVADACADWQVLYGRLVGNPVAAAVLNVHQPEAGYDRVVCGSCFGDEDYEAASATWPCVTYEAVRGAAVC